MHLGSVLECLTDLEAIQAESSSPLADVGFRQLIESIQRYAIATLNPSGQIVSWNSGAQAITGFSLEETFGRGFWFLYPQQQRVSETPTQLLESALESGSFEEETQFIRRDGCVIWVQVSITPIRDSPAPSPGFAMVFHDISERKGAEEKTRLMLELAANAIILVNATGHLLLANPQVEKLFGYSQTELIGQPVEILVPESARVSHPHQREQFLANPSVRAMGAGRDLHGRHKDGSEFPVEIGLNPIHTGDELLVVVSIVDITERKRSEENARRHLAELAHAGRLSTMGEMLSGLAHEINQPLAAAANYARACVRFAQSGDQVTKEQLQEWMEKAAAQVDRASEIVKRLGSFLKKDRSRRTVLNLNQLVNDVIGLSRLLIPPSGSRNPAFIDVDLNESLPAVFADKVQIEQVLLNLIRNAIEAVEELPDDQRRLIIRTEPGSKLILVSVTDNGQGITLEHQSQLFNPFFTTKSEGMGLGLSISRSIIEAHDGRMLVESRPDHGTTISFLLPIYQQDNLA